MVRNLIRSSWSTLYHQPPLVLFTRQSHHHRRSIDKELASSHDPHVPKQTRVLVGKQIPPHLRTRCDSLSFTSNSHLSESIPSFWSGDALQFQVSERDTFVDMASISDLPRRCPIMPQAAHFVLRVFCVHPRFSIWHASWLEMLL